MSKKLIQGITLSSLIGIFIFGIAVHKNIIKFPIQKTIEVQYAADFSDDKIFMGASHHVFVGKVIKEAGTKDAGMDPETQFEVEVIHNIKGNLQGNVIVEQAGGYINGVLYLVHGGDVVLPQESANRVPNADSLFVPGSTYLFATRYNKEEDWHTSLSHPNAKKLISANKNLTFEQLKLLAEKDVRVIQLKEAYKSETPFEIDVKSGNQLNSYSSLQAGQKTK